MRSCDRVNLLADPYRQPASSTARASTARARKATDGNRVAITAVAYSLLSAAAEECPPQPAIVFVRPIQPPCSPFASWQANGASGKAHV
jgi:hypothetical protein